MTNLLLELLSEEIPARMQARAADDLKSIMGAALCEKGLSFDEAAAFSTPRRLTLAISGLSDESPTVHDERKGPRVDAPAKAIDGFIRSAGVTRDQLEIRDDKKGQTYFAKITRPSRPATDIVTEAVSETIQNFPWSKSMRWGSGNLRWVRPLQSILCILHDDDQHTVIPVEIDTLTASDTTRGHRFMGSGEFAVKSFADYKARLLSEKVILDARERAKVIHEASVKLAHEAGCDLVEDIALLNEVAGLVEWPVVLMGAIGEDFLSLPPEVLQTSMKEHQKFFSLRAKDGRINGFITVANRETADEGRTILDGNQKVLSARLSDARFFWENDLRIARAGMGEWCENLKSVTFHNKLGTVSAQTDRITALARCLSGLVNCDVERTGEAARLAKADLTSEMVYEFPELQGIMGGYYAEAAGLHEDVARAIKEHRSPTGPSDAVPTSPVSVAVALADKIDILAGFWAIGEKPTGSKDPFALRRGALGMIRLILENDLRLDLADLRTLIRDAGLGESVIMLDEAQARDLMGFIHDRLVVYLRDRGLSHDVLDACMGMPDSGDLTVLVKRAEALEKFRASDDGDNLIQVFKRANNLLSQAEDADGVEYSFGADAKFMDNDDERALFAALASAQPDIDAALKGEDFATAMAIIARLRGPIDRFIVAVKINTDSQVVRRNRLNLLGQIRSACVRIADLSRLQG